MHTGPLPTRCAFGAIALVVAGANGIGCKTSIEPIAGPTPEADTGIADTGIADTGIADTAIADTGIADTGIADTGIADTGIADTGIADTGIANTDTADTGIMDAGVVDASDAGQCASGAITLNLVVDATGPVYFSGPWPQWVSPAGNCSTWLTIAPAGALPRSIFKNLCGACRGGFESARPQSFTWDGTFYAIPNQLDASCAQSCCGTPVCAPDGEYVATFCVGYADADAASPGTAPPTCKQVSFVWPPSSANQSISETITPTPDGG